MLINPKMSDVEVILYTDQFRNHVENYHGFEDEQDMFFTRDDALKILKGFMEETEKVKFKKLLQELYKVIESLPTDLVPGINVENYPEYVDVLVKCRPELLQDKLFRKYFLREEQKQ
jgi:hypothetical protein